MIEGQRDRYGPDALCLAWLSSCVLLVVCPAWWRTHATLLDNPAHAAEILQLARGGTNGWTDQAFAGFDITLFHSPLLYGCAALGVRIGAPIQLVYPLCCVLGFVAPALACFVVARAYLRPVPATLLALALLLRPEGIVGVQSPLGGVWPFGVALAVFTLLAWRLGRSDEIGARRFVPIAILVGLTLSAHVLGLLLVPLAFAAHLGSRFSSVRGERRRLTRDSLAFLVGASLGAGSYLPFLMSRGWMVTTTTAMSLGELLRPLTSAPILTLALLLAGVSGVVASRRRRDEVPRIGAALAVLSVVFLLLVVQVGALGIYSLRVIPVLRIGLVLASIPFAASAWAQASERARVLVIVAGVALSLPVSYAWGAAIGETALETSSPAYREVESLWAWLRTHRTEAWGRVYLQDTFRSPAWPERARRSHLLARTHDETGVDQVGAYYSSFPAPTSHWTRAEHGRLFDREITTLADVAFVLTQLEALGATHLVIVDPASRSLFASSEGLEERFRTERFTLYERRGSSRAYAVSSRARVEAVERPRPGRTVIDVLVLDAPATLSVRDAFHPWWVVRGGGRVARGPHDLIEIRDVPAGRHRLELDYEAPRWPWLVSLAGLAALGLGARALRARGKS